jgi:predicted N-acetyltransferase YhbS
MHASNGGLQVGFVRVVSDFEFLAYIGDVFVSEPWRRKGVGFRLIKEAMRSAELSGVRTWHATSDVAFFFEALGFRRINPSRNFVFRNLPGTSAAKTR